MSVLYDLQQNQKRVRVAIEGAKREARSSQNDKRDEALDYFDGIESLDILRGYYAARYGYRLAKETSADSGYESYAYKKGMAADAIRYGMYQAVETKTLHMIVRSIACLFTQPDMKFDFYDETGAKTDDFASVINELREDGEFQKHLIRTDKISALLGSSAMLMSYKGGGIRYQGGLGPQVVFVRWPDYLIDDGDKRECDKSDLEDAECVVILLESAEDLNSSDRNCKYAAYFGRSEQYEHGRYVVYWANDPFKIPPIGSSGIIEYEHPSLGSCNPLTAMQDLYDDGFAICPHEYPLAVLHGQDVGLSSVFPETSFSLYDNAIECDILNSRIAKAVDISARGSIAVILDEGGVPPENPDEGVCIMPRGARREISNVPSAGAVDGATVLQQCQLQIAAGYSVPGYELVSNQSGIPESGVALAIRSQPKRDSRRERVNSSVHFVDRIYKIECGLLRYFGKLEQQIPATVSQTWSPGEWTPPTSSIDSLAEIKAKYDMGAIDYVEAVRQANGLADRESAKQLIDAWKADSAMYPGPNSRTALRIPPRGELPGLP